MHYSLDSVGCSVENEEKKKKKKIWKSGKEREQKPEFLLF
jgi:hypothetical protein